MVDNKKVQFSAIYDQYIEKIYRFVYLKVSSQEIAEDVTSKVFLKGWESYNKQSDIVNPGAFLYRIANNAVIDHYREKGKIKVVSTDTGPQILDNRTNIYESAILSSDVLLVKSAIQNIKEEYKNIIIWHYLDGMDVPEIADILEKPVGTVRVMLHRGLKSLKDELKGKIQEA
jgi:RNA polymerase sigma-70 factor (ECF subfamily)